MNPEDERTLVEVIHRNNELLAIQVRQSLDWKVPFRNGILAGFGGVLGATILVSLVVWVLQPFSAITPLKPTLERLTQALERDNQRR